MTDDELQDLRRELARVARGQWYPDALRERATAWTRAQRDAGETWGKISAAVGVPAETLRRWKSGQAHAHDASCALVPIEVVLDREVESTCAEDRAVRITTKGGHQIDGLTIADVIAIVRVLG
jgi:hypothetical protein